MKKIFFLLINILILSSCQTLSTSVSFTTQSGYSTGALVYLPDKKESQNIVFVIMHGKSSSPDKPFRVELYSQLTSKGYKVIAPKMPWSKDWSGTPNDGIALIDEIVDELSRKGKKTVLIGHSLGGANALIYASTNPKKDVIGIIAVAPAHMLHRSRKMQKKTSKSVAHAQKMVNSGKGDVKSYFTGFNTGRTKSNYTTANIYLSYYDTNVFPDVEQLLPTIKPPILWIAGDQDKLTRIYNMESLFNDLPNNPKNKYLENSGSHKSVLANSAQDIIKWVQKL